MVPPIRLGPLGIQVSHPAAMLWEDCGPAPTCWGGWISIQGRSESEARRRSEDDGHGENVGQRETAANSSKKAEEEWWKREDEMHQCRVTHATARNTKSHTTQDVLRAAVTVHSLAR